MNKDILEEYAGLKQKIAILTAQAKELEPEVLGELHEEGVETAKFPFGTFSITHRTAWEYSDKFQDLKEQHDAIIKAAQTTEQENGKATKVETEILTYRNNESRNRAELQFQA